MGITVCNPQKGRLETMKITTNESNTTWFDDCIEPDDILMVTDTDIGLLIKENNYNHPVLVYGVTRVDVGDDPEKAKMLRDQAMPE